MVQDKVSPLTDIMAGAKIANVTLHKPEAPPLLISNQPFHLSQIAPFAGGKIVEPDHPLIQSQQMFQQIGSDEAGNAGDQPCFRIRL
jgi:hypothetical protein